MNNDFIISQEDSYNIDLRFYFQKNKGKTEYDFLKENIDFLEDSIREEKKLTDEDFLTKKKKEERPHYVNDDNVDDWANQALSFHKKRTENSLHLKNVKLSDYKFRLKRLPKQEKTIVGNFIDGKKINLYERFLIANEVLQIEKKIRILKISESEKHKLLSLILGCNIDNAKKIMINKYDAKVKEPLLQEYYKTLIK